ncbi:hypothetical protein [Microbulbifer magnicolonia]|uniref:energy transducer TonB n=1 Tax=Microbulbifer magnicolonia TaxID=3109744 RepID=UPI002B408AD8|nr:hypothetical protein [Microbulbifer sp. GG15]
MVKSLLIVLSLAAAGQASALDWQRPDCAAYQRESECFNAMQNDYRQAKQNEFRDEGLSFWYYERPDFSVNEAAQKALDDKLEGALLVSFTVERDGSVSNVVLKDKSSDEVTVYAAPIITAVSNWQFVPTDTRKPDREWRFAFLFEKDECEKGEEKECDSKADSDK